MVLFCSPIISFYMNLTTAFLLLSTMFFSSFSAKEEEHVRWVFSARPIKEYEYMLVFEAKMDKNWHIYSQEIVGDALPTTFYFMPNNQVEFIDPQMEEKGEAIIKNALTYYKDRVLFTTNIRLKTPSVQLIGYVNFISCNGERCLTPKDIPFEFVFGKKSD